MKLQILSADEAAASGLTHKLTVTYADLTTANAAHAQTLITLQAGQFVAETAHRLVTDFVSANGTALGMALGNGSGANVYGASKDLQGTEVDYWRTSIATPPTGAADQAGETEAVLATFTSTGGSSPLASEYTAGEVAIGLRIVNLPKL